MSVSQIVLVLGGMGVGSFMQMDKEKALFFLSKYCETKQHHPHSLISANHSLNHFEGQNKIHASLSVLKPIMVSAIVGGGFVFLKSFSFNFDDIMYVSKSTFYDVATEIQKKIEMSKVMIEKVYDNLQSHIGVVEKKVDSHAEDIKQEMNVMEGMIQNLEQKLQNASKERQFVSRGIHLLCKTVSKNIEDSSELNEYCSVPMATYVFPSSKTRALYDWSTRALFEKK